MSKVAYVINNNNNLFYVIFILIFIDGAPAMIGRINGFAALLTQ